MKKNKRGRPAKEGTKLYIRIAPQLQEKLRADSRREKRDLTATIELILEKHYANEAVA